MGFSLGSIGKSIGGKLSSITGGDLFSGAVDIGLGFLGAKSAEDAAQLSAGTSLASAREQMEFQRKMSNTAHQREVRDLRRAGLNPLLSTSAGASTPGGAGYSYPYVNVAEKGIESMAASAAARKAQTERRGANQTVKNLKKMEDNIGAQTNMFRANSSQALMQEFKAWNEARNIQKQGRILDAGVAEAELDLSIHNSPYGRWLRLQDKLFKNGAMPAAIMRMMGPLKDSGLDNFNWNSDGTVKNTK